MAVRPCTIQDAKALVTAYHRRCRAPLGGLFAIGYGDPLIGAAIVGRPVARKLQDGFTCEVTRVVVPEGHPNACSELYGACARAAKAMGYRRILTYTLSSEGGSSLKGAGWKNCGKAGGGSWNRAERPRLDDHPLEVKTRWECAL